MRTAPLLGVIVVLLLAFSSFVGVIPRGAQAVDVNNPTVTYRIPCIADTYTALQWPDFNGGTNENSFCDVDEYLGSWPANFSNQIEYAWWKFDISSLPPNLVIDSAVANFYSPYVASWNWSFTGFDSFTLVAHRPNADWNETNLTWNNQPAPTDHGQLYNVALISYTQVPRMSPGNIPGYSWPDENGTFHPDDPVNYTDSIQQHFRYISVDMTVTTQGWYDGAFSNWGLLLSIGGYSSSPHYTTIYWLTRHLSNPYAQQTPYLEVTAHSKETTVHLSYYDSLTGEGIAPWTFNVSASIDNGQFSRISPDITGGLFGKTLTVRVKDFFGNELYNGTRTMTEAVYYWDIGLAIYSYKFYNQNPRFAMLEIYYNLAGQPYSEFIPPNDVVNRYLKAGTYRFNITFYSEIGVKGDEYTWVRTIPSITFPGAGFVILKGDTISEVIDAVTGVHALVRVAVQLVSPSVLWQGRDIPQIPSNILAVSTSVVINNLYMLTASTNQIQTGNLLDFTSPIPDSVQDSAIPRDYFRFSGPYSTTVFINDTNTGENRYNATTIPPSVAVTGSGAYEVDTSNNVTCSREVDFRWYRAFTWHYYPGENNKYTVELAIENSLVTPWLNATLFIPFMNSSYVNNQSVEVYDMNNTVNLVEGLHWIQSEQGVYMWFSQWNASVWRGFRLTYNSVNESNFNAPVHITVNKVGDDTGLTYIWNKDSFYFARASWTNSYRQTYHGSIYIDLTFDMSVDSTTVKVLTPTGNVIIDIIVAGKTIIIPEVIVPVGDKLEYTIIFKSVQKNNIFDMEFANIPIVVTSGFIALAAFILGIFFTQFRKGDKKSEAWGRIFIGVAVLALMLVVVVFIYFLGIMT